MKNKISFTVLLAFAALPIVAAASDYQGALSCKVEFFHEERLFDDVSYDTGWVPSSTAELRLRFFIHAGGGICARLPGEAVLSWPERYNLSWRGEQDGGELNLDVGMIMEGKFAWDLPGIGSGETDLPMIPNFDFLFDDAKAFSPYVLEGNPGRPVHVEDTVDGGELYTIDLAALLGVQIPGINGGIRIMASGNTAVDFSGIDLTTFPKNGDAIVHVIEDQVQTWPDRGNLHEEGQALYRAELDVSATMTLTPEIFVEYFGQTWEQQPFDVPVELLNQAYTWNFEAEPLLFEYLPPPDGLDGGSSDGGDDDDGDSDQGDADPESNTDQHGDCECGHVCARNLPSVLSLLLFDVCAEF